MTTTSADTPHLRVARPVTDLQRSVTQYQQGLGLARIGGFVDHEGFDGVMLGHPAGGYHFEFTHCRHHPVAPSPTPEDLIVFYVPDEAAWAARCAALLTAGFREIEPFNAYWARAGRTFEDADGYRLVIQRAAWQNPAHAD